MRNAVHQIGTDIPKSDGTGIGKEREKIGDGVTSPQVGKFGVVNALQTDAQAVDAEVAERMKIGAVGGCRVAFAGDLARGREVEAIGEATEQLLPAGKR